MNWVRIPIKFLATLLAFFILWQASTFSDWLANQPSDFAVLGAALVISVSVIAFIGVVFLLWRGQLRKGKQWFFQD